MSEALDLDAIEKRAQSGCYPTDLVPLAAQDVPALLSECRSLRSQLAGTEVILQAERETRARAEAKAKQGAEEVFRLTNLWGDEGLGRRALSAEAERDYFKRHVMHYRSTLLENAIWFREAGFPESEKAIHDVVFGQCPSMEELQRRHAAGGAS